MLNSQDLTRRSISPFFRIQGIRIAIRVSASMYNFISDNYEQPQIIYIQYLCVALKCVGRML